MHTAFDHFHVLTGMFNCITDLSHSTGLCLFVFVAKVDKEMTWHGCQKRPLWRAVFVENFPILKSGIDFHPGWVDHWILVVIIVAIYWLKFLDISVLDMQKNCSWDGLHSENCQQNVSTGQKLISNEDRLVYSFIRHHHPLHSACQTLQQSKEVSPGVYVMNSFPVAEICIHKGRKQGHTKCTVDSIQQSILQTSSSLLISIRFQRLCTAIINS